MKGIYLNDIPISTFINYFESIDVVDKTYSSVEEDYTSYVYTYTIVTNLGTYDNYKSIHSKLIDTSTELVAIFETDTESITSVTLTATSGVKELTYIKIAETSDDITSVYPYEKYFVPENDPINYFAEIVGSDLVDLRKTTPDNILTNITVVSKTYYDEVYDSSGIFIGSLYTNQTFKIHKVDASGNYLYTDPTGLETTRKYDRSNFLRHNQLMRTGFGMNLGNQNILDKFDEGTIGILDIGDHKKALYYEDFTFSTIYEKVTYATMIGAAEGYTQKRMDRKVLHEIELAPYNITKTIPVIKEVLDFNSLEVHDGVFKENNVNDIIFYINTELNTSPTVDNNITVRRYEETVGFKDEVYPMINSTSVNIPLLGGLVEVDGSNFKLYRTNDKIFFNGQNYNVVINATGAFTYIENIIYKLEEDNFIYYPIQGRKKEYIENYFGKCTAKDATTFTLSKTDISGSQLSFSDPENKYYGYTLGAPEIEYYQDTYDDELCVRVTTELNRKTLTALDYTRYIDHLGTDILTDISTPLTEEDFFGNFKDGDHYIPNLYFKYRGPVIEDGVFEKQKRTMLGSMTLEYVNKYLQEFLIVDSALYDPNTLLKMRVYSEGINHLLTKDYRNNSILLPSNIVLKYSDINNIAILQENIFPSKNVKTYKGDDTYAETAGKGNVFERLLDYERFPYNKSRYDYYREYSKREQSYVDSLIVKKNIFNDIPEFDLSLRKNSTARTEFKENIVQLLTRSFYEFNKKDYKYVNDYTDFYDSKLSTLVPKYEDDIKDTSYKFVFTINDVGTTREDDFISNILSIDKDWKVR